MSEGPRLFRILLEVSDLDEASAFYAALFDAAGRRVGGGRHYYDCGDVIVGLVDVSPGGKKPRRAPENFYFAVADLEQVHSRASALGCLSKENVHDESAGEILTRPWGERSFYAQDPFGNALCFVDEKTVFTGESK